MRTQPSARDERGSSLVLALFVILAVSLLAASLLFTVHVDMASSRLYSDWTKGLSDTDSGIAEAMWRLNLTPGPAAPPNGSTVSVNLLTNYDAAIDFDPHNILSNDDDDDGDGVTDESDELNLARDWSVKVLLRPNVFHPGFPEEVVDTVIPTGPPWGSKFVVPTIQRQANWKLYTTPDAPDPDTLIMHYRLTNNTTPPQIVFYDPDLVTNGVENLNTLSALGGDGNPANDSPYNITWTSGVVTVPATGYPVMEVESVGRIVRGSNVMARRQAEAEAVHTSRKLLRNGACSCRDMKVEGSGLIDSYRSSDLLPAYPAAGATTVGHLSSNGKLDLKNTFTVRGNLTSKDDMEVDKTIVVGNATSGDTIDVKGGGSVSGTKTQNVEPEPEVCPCDELDTVQLVAQAKLANNNGTILPDNIHPLRYGTTTVMLDRLIYRNGPGHLIVDMDSTIILTGGRYYFETLSISHGGRIQIGQDLQFNDGIVDAPPSKAVHIFVKGGVHLGGEGIRNFGRPRDLLLFTGSTADVRFIDNAPFRGVVFAPWSNIDLDGDNDITGALVGWDVERHGASPIHYDEALLDTLVVPGPSTRVAWREVQP